MEKLKEAVLALFGLGFLFVFKDSIEIINRLWEITRGLPQYWADLSTAILGSLAIIAIAKASKN